jgi:malate dehydrogenase (oxaloacetate-decarboxylating)
MDSARRTEALEFHKKARGKVQIFPTVNIRSERQLALAYVPGSTPVCEEIGHDSGFAYDYTGKANRLAEISNGTAVLGMGDVGPAASIPVLEGKCLLLKLLGDINAIPMAIDARDAGEIISFCRMIAPTVGGINIEDVSSPSSFTVVRELSDRLDIPIFCDDQHGTAVIILSAVKNALKLINLTIGEARTVVLGAGAAGIAAADLLLKSGARDIIVLNEHGILGPSNPSMDPVQSDLSKRTNPRGVKGDLDSAIDGADILIGLSRSGIVSKEHIGKMNKHPVILALALPDPEISSKDAAEAGAYLYASGRPEDTNTLLNIHAFPGIVRGALDVRARKLTDSMLVAAADALAGTVDRRHLSTDHICPRFLGNEATPRIAEAVGQAAIKDGLALLRVPEGKIYSDTWERLFGEMEHI